MYRTLKTKAVLLHQCRWLSFNILLTILCENTKNRRSGFNSDPDTANWALTKRPICLLTHSIGLWCMLTSVVCVVSWSPAASSWHGSGRAKRPPAAAAAGVCTVPTAAAGGCTAPSCSPCWANNRQQSINQFYIGNQQLGCRNQSISSPQGCS